MEIKLESKIGKLNSDCDRIYNLLSDCNNFQKITANDRIKDWHSDSDSCSFAINEVGSVVFRIVERRPNELIKFSVENAQAENIFLWMQLKSVTACDTRVKITAKLDVNPVMSVFITKPVKNLLNKIVETLEYMCK